MTAEEIIRRLRALIAMPQKERPISLYYLDILAGLSRGKTYEIAKAEHVMREQTRIRLERALTWVENNQVTIVKRPGGPMGGRPSDVKIGPPRPPQVTVSIVRFTKQGPRIQSLAFNPLAMESPQTKAKEQ